MTDVVGFRIDPANGRNRSVSISINGRGLDLLVGDLERSYLPPGSSNAQPGDYSPLNADLLDTRHFLDEPRHQVGGTVLLGCGCGTPECWALTATVLVTGESVTWRDFHGGNPRWSLSALGPFVFDRAQYEAAMIGATATGSNSPTPS